MEKDDKMANPVRTIVRSALIIIWWVCIWGLTDYFIHHISSKSPFHKIIFYIGLMVIILGTLGLDPHMLYYM